MKELQDQGLAPDTLWMDGKRAIIRKNGKTIFRYPKGCRVKFADEYKASSYKGHITHSPKFGYGLDGMASGLLGGV